MQGIKDNAAKLAATWRAKIADTVRIKKLFQEGLVDPSWTQELEDGKPAAT